MSLWVHISQLDRPSTTNSFAQMWYSKGQGKVSDGTPAGTLFEYFRFQFLNGPLDFWILVGCSYHDRSLYELGDATGHLLLGDHKEAVTAMVATRRNHFTSSAFVIFLEGLMPCFKWACVRQRSGHHGWMSYQDLQLANGRRDTPLMTSLILVFRTVAS